MLRKRLSLAAAALSIVGVIAISFAQDEKLGGPVLPPPSLFDEPASQVHAVEAPKSEPAPVVVKAKPAPVMEDAPAPEPQAAEEEVAPKVVWWKPWTWFSGRRKAPEPESAAPEMQEKPAVAVQSGREARADTGYAFDSPAKIIRSGMGTCLRTGMWQDNAHSPECGSAVAGHDGGSASGSAVANAPAAPAKDPSAAGETKPTTATASGRAEPNPVEVSALAPEREAARKPLGADDQFETIRPDASARGGDGAALSADAAAMHEAQGKAGDAHNQAATTGGKRGTGAKASSNGTGSMEMDKSMTGADVTGIGANGGEKPLSMSAEALFGFKSSKLLTGGKKQLDKVAAQLSTGGFQHVRVVGHTDRVGNPVRNKRLSLKRARAVKEYLVMKGVEPSRISVEGRGSAEPITEPRQCDGLSVAARRACEAPDRRVEIVVTRSLAKRKNDTHAGG